MATTSNRSSGTQINKRGITQGNTLVDPISGLPIDVIEDGDGKKRLCVDSTLEVGSISVDVDLIPADDQVGIGDPDTGDFLKVESDGSINVNIKADSETGDTVAIGAHKVSLFDESAGEITAPVFTEIYSFTSTDSGTRIIALEMTAQTPCIFVIKLNGNTIRMLRSSSLERNMVCHFREPRALPTGATLTVEARVEKMNLSTYSTFTSLEGYIN